MGELLNGWKRTCYCTELTEDDAGREVTLMGWANVRRDLGALIFVQLRDRTGLMQVVFDSGALSPEDLRAPRRSGRSSCSPCAARSYGAPARW